MIIQVYREQFTKDREFSDEINDVMKLARDDLCEINDVQHQSENSIIIGNTCKQEFVKVMARV